MKNLKWGSEGKPVSKLQEELNKSGRAGQKLKVDGIFGPKTYAAVKKFQGSCKGAIKVDGVYGPKTAEQLEIALGRKKPVWPFRDWLNDRHDIAKFGKEMVKQDAAGIQAVKDLEKFLTGNLPAFKAAYAETHKLLFQAGDAVIRNVDDMARLQFEFGKVAATNPKRAAEILKEMKSLEGSFDRITYPTLREARAKMLDLLKALKALEATLPKLKAAMAKAP